MDASSPYIDQFEGTLPEHLPRIVRGEPRGDDWFRVSNLADLQTGQLATVLQAMATNRGYPDPRTIGASFTLIASPATLGMFWRATQEQSLPLLDPSQVWWQISPFGNVRAISVAQQPDVVPATQLGEVLHGLLNGLMAAVSERTGFPVRGQWSILVSAFGQWLLDAMPDEHRRALSMSATALATDQDLARSAPRVTWVDERKAFTTRKVCCFNYRGTNGAYCSSQCPIVPADERLAFATAQMAAS